MFNYILTIVVILAVAAFYSLYIKPHKQIIKYVKDFQSQGYRVYLFPYNPFKFPIFQTILKDSEEGDALKTYKSQFSKYDLIVGNIFTTPALAFLSPETRKQFAKNQIDFNYTKIPLITNLWSKVFGKGLVFSQGSVWKRKRRIISKFFTYDFINSKIPQIYQIIDECLDQYQKELLIQKPSKIQAQNQYKFQLIKLVTLMFSNVILSIFLGTQSLEEKVGGERICHFMVKLVNDFNMRINQTLPLMFGPKFIDLGLTAKDRQITRKIRLFNSWASAYIDNLILRKTKENSNSNMLYLLHQSKQYDQKMQCYDKKQLIDQLKIFFFAGTDTTSHFLEMIIYLTSQNSQVNLKLRKEIKNFQQKKLTLQDLKSLKYIDAIQKQTVRFYGPLPVDFPRIVVKSHYFKGVPINKGTAVQYIATPTHYNSQFYRQPFNFSPQRWLNQKKQYDASQLTGFGMGPRSCIGQYLAHIQSKIAIVLIFNRYKKIIVPDQINLRWKSMYEPQKFQIKVSKSNK